MSEYHLPIQPEGMIDEFDAAQILEISLDELQQMRAQGRGPAYVAIVHDIVRYYPHVVFAYGEQIITDDEFSSLGF